MKIPSLSNPSHSFGDALGVDLGTRRIHLDELPAPCHYSESPIRFAITQKTFPKQSRYLIASNWKSGTFDCDLKGSRHSLASCRTRVILNTHSITTQCPLRIRAPTPITPTASKHPLVLRSFPSSSPRVRELTSVETLSLPMSRRVGSEVEAGGDGGE